MGETQDFVPLGRFPKTHGTKFINQGSTRLAILLRDTRFCAMSTFPKTYGTKFLRQGSLG